MIPFIRFADMFGFFRDGFILVEEEVAAAVLASCLCCPGRHLRENCPNFFFPALNANAQLSTSRNQSTFPAVNGLFKLLCQSQ